MRTINREELVSDHYGYKMTAAGELVSSEAFHFTNTYQNENGEWVYKPTQLFSNVDALNEWEKQEIKAKEDNVAFIAAEELGYKKSFVDLMNELGACEEQRGRRVIYTLDVEYPESADGYRAGRVVKKTPSMGEAIMMADPEIYRRAREIALDNLKKWEEENGIEYVLIAD